MALKRAQAGDCTFKLRIKRDGEIVESPSGENDLSNLVNAAFIMEGIGQATYEAEIVMGDGAGVINSLTGSELWVLTIATVHKTATYNLRSYAITDRKRSGNSEGYIIKCVSDEFLKNECINVFGPSKTLFDNKLQAEEIVKKLVEDKKYLNSKKKLHFEKTRTKNQHKFVACNWRVLDTVYWVGNLSQRATGGAGANAKPQNGFLFWENMMGYHFKSIDKMIDDVNAMNPDQESNLSEGKAKLYKYSYEPKKSGDESSDDRKINAISFPTDRDYLTGMRQGAWSGYSVGFDVSNITNSRVSADALTAFEAHKYDVSDFWGAMSHVGRSTSKNPVESYDEDIKAMIKKPKRIRYAFLPNRNWDVPKWQFAGISIGSKTETNKQYDEIPYLQAYQHLRVQTLKNTRLMVSIPGNLDLYSGYGIDIRIPKTKPKGDKMETDYKYSGRYVISGIRHVYADESLTTELMLCRDAMPLPK